MTRRAAVRALLLLSAGCASKEPPVAVEREAAVCPVACGSVQIVGSLVKLTPASRVSPYFVSLERTSAGWAVAWHSDMEAHSYLQRVDEQGVPMGQTLAIRDAQGVDLHWDGTSLALWADIYATNQLDVTAQRRRMYARFDAMLTPIESATLLGPEVGASLAAFDFDGVQTVVTATPALGVRVSALHVAPGLGLTSSQHFLSQAPQATARAAVAWTGKQLAVAYFTPAGYRVTLLDPRSLSEMRTVELGEATGEAPQDIQLAVGETLLWAAVWERASQTLWLRATDLASGEPALEPVLLAWPSAFHHLTTVGDTPIVIGAPPHSLGEPENNVIFPVDPQTKSVCRGTRLGNANVTAIHLDGNEGAALLDVFQKDLYFARIRCSQAP